MVTRAGWKATFAGALVVGLLIGAGLSYAIDAPREPAQDSSPERAESPPREREQGSSPTPRPQAVDFKGDFETGNHSQWSSVQEAESDRIQVVRDPVREGRFASRHEVRSGDRVAEGTRAELLWGSSEEPTLREGSEHYFGWSTYFGMNFPSPDHDEGHSVFLQWKDEGDGSPPMEMSAREERIALRIDNVDRWAIPLTRGVWHDFVARVRFSSDDDEGLIEIWHDGVKVVEGLRTSTLKPDQSSYLKLGYYRSEEFEEPGVIYHDGMRVGSSYEAVAPRD